MTDGQLTTPRPISWQKKPVVWIVALVGLLLVGGIALYVWPGYLGARLRGPDSATLYTPIVRHLLASENHCYDNGSTYCESRFQTGGEKEFTVAYLFREKPRNLEAIGVYGCFNEKTKDYIVTFDNPKDCQSRKLPYLFYGYTAKTDAFENSVELLRCYKRSNNNTLVSTDRSECESTGHTDLIQSMGYATRAAGGQADVLPQVVINQVFVSDGRNIGHSFSYPATFPEDLPEKDADYTSHLLYSFSSEDQLKEIFSRDANSQLQLNLGLIYNLEARQNFGVGAYVVGKDNLPFGATYEGFANYGSATSGYSTLAMPILLPEYEGNPLEYLRKHAKSTIIAKPGEYERYFFDIKIAAQEEGQSLPETTALLEIHYAKSGATPVSSCADAATTLDADKNGTITQAEVNAFGRRFHTTYGSKQGDPKYDPTMNVANCDQQVIDLQDVEVFGKVIRDRGLVGPNLWQNPVNQYDVNNDGTVNASDTLQVVNALNADRGGKLSDWPSVSDVPPYLDVDGDRQLTDADHEAMLEYLRKTTTPTPTPTPAPSSISLSKVEIKKCEVTVEYAKNFATCGHLLLANNTALSLQNNLCQNTGPVTVAKSTFTSGLQAGAQVKLCNGNNYGECSGVVTVSGGGTCN